MNPPRSATPDLIFWQAMPSPHLAPWLRALAGGPGRVGLVLMGGLEPGRRAMGWQPPDLDGLEVAYVPDEATVDEYLARPGAVQVFSSFINHPRLAAILARAARGPARLGLLSEGRDWRGIKGALRLADAFRHERRYARRAEFALAMGALGVEWYRRCGFDPARVYEFGYAVEAPPTLEIPPGAGKRMRWLFVGQWVRRKRVDLLLKALARLPAGDWSLRVVGDGPERESLAGLAERLGLAGHVAFVGTLDNALVRRELAGADGLILPSHWDGWGAVINEALMAGTRVVCGDSCGAAVLVRDTACGRVFRGGSVDALAGALDAELRRGRPDAAERRAIRAYGEGVSGPALAAYAREILAHLGDTDPAQEKPVPPWRVRHGG